MNSFEKFNKDLKGTGLSEEETMGAFRSMKRSIRSFYISKKRSIRERREEEKFQKPLFERIKSKIPAELKCWHNLFREESEIRAEGEERKISPITVEKILLESRVKNFKKILKFEHADRIHYEKLREKMEKIWKKERNSKIWKVGLGVGVTFLGLGVVKRIYDKHKNHEEKD